MHFDDSGDQLVDYELLCLALPARSSFPGHVTTASGAPLPLARL